MAKPRSFPERLAYLAERKPLLSISVLGYMGEGKTNFARYACKILRPRGFHCYYAVVDEPEKLAEALYAIQDDGVERALLVLDDASGTLSGKARSVREVENVFVRARHIAGTRNLVVLVVFHYVYLVNPVFRLTPIYVLTSISTDHEISTLVKSGLYTREWLEAFKKLYLAWLWGSRRVHRLADPRRYKPVLARIYDHVEIHMTPLIEDDPWDRVIGETRQRKPRIDYEEFRTILELKLGLNLPEKKMQALYQLVTRLFA